MLMLVRTAHLPMYTMIMNYALDQARPLSGRVVPSIPWADVPSISAVYVIATRRDEAWTEYSVLSSL